MGVNVVAGRTFSTSYLKPLIKFRSSANTVLNIHNKPSEQVMLKLLYSMCVPNVTYASDVLQYSAKHMQSMNVELHDCFRRIFGYNRWESTRFCVSLLVIHHLLTFFINDPANLKHFIFFLFTLVFLHMF